MSDTLWTADDVAAFLKLSRRAIYSLCGLPRVELPGNGARPIVRYDPAEVRAWAANRSTRRTGRAA
jgi:hypothetical protein